MNDDQDVNEPRANARVVLGPVALKLIEDWPGNRKSALDQAITALLNAEENMASPSDQSSEICRKLPDNTRGIMNEIADRIEGMCDLMAMEMQSVRLLVTALLDENGGQHAELCEMCHDHARKIHERPGAVSDVTLARLQKQREAAERDRQDLQRIAQEHGFAPPEIGNEPEIER